MIEKIYIGSYSDNIKICEFNNGTLNIVGQIENANKPSYLNINKKFIYAVSEINNGSIEIFKATKGGFKQVETRTIEQALPCYITTNKQNSLLLVANYGSGSVIMYKLKQDGCIEKQINKIEYPFSHMHFAEFINNDIYVVDLGNDTIYIYNNKMELISKIYTGPKTGPRHIAMTKDSKTMYVVAEMSNQIFVYNKYKNEFKLVQTLSTLPKQKIESFAGAIKISNNDRYIYVTNRGHDSISVFKNSKGKLKLIQNIPSYGIFPRDILLNKNEKYIMVANQKSNNIVIFKRNIDEGTLSKIEGADVDVEKPSCIVRSNYGI